MKTLKEFLAEYKPQKKTKKNKIIKELSELSFKNQNSKTCLKELIDWMP